VHFFFFESFSSLLLLSLSSLFPSSLASSFFALCFFLFGFAVFQALTAAFFLVVGTSASAGFDFLFVVSLIKNR
jgi:hypothetical protein